MDTEIYLVIILGFTVLALFARRQVLHAFVTIALTLANVYILFFSFDRAARIAMVFQLKGLEKYTQYEAGVQTMRLNLLDYRLILAVSFICLCLLILRRAKN